LNGGNLRIDGGVVKVRNLEGLADGASQADLILQGRTGKRVYIGQDLENKRSELIAYGNVGLGIESPGEKLEVDGNIKIAHGHRLFTKLIAGISDEGNDGALLMQRYSNSPVEIGSDYSGRRADLITHGNVFARHIKGQTYGGAPALLYINRGESLGDVYIGGGGGDTDLIVEKDITVGRNFGLGTSSPDERFHIENGNLRIDNSGKVKVRHIEGLRVDGAAPEELYLQRYTGRDVIIGQDLDNKRASLITHGSMAVGSDVQSGYRLAVNGNIKAKQVEVSSQGWADFVFEENYQLKSLDQVAKFIDENGHLPDVPSAKEVSENGLNLGQMDALLLQKIEELTLYIIALKKENGQIKKELNLSK